MRMSDWSSDVCSSDLDRVDRARFLTEAAIDALRHVDVVARRAARPVVARLGLDRDRLRRADRPAPTARDAALLAVRTDAPGTAKSSVGKDVTCMRRSEL